MTYGVIFDLWNTLITVDGPRLVTRLARLINDPLTASGEDHTRTGGSDVTTADVIEYLRATGCLHISVPIVAIATDLWERRWRTAAPDCLEDLVAVEEKEFVHASRMKDDAEKIVDWVHSQKMKSAIVSNASAVSLQVLSRLDLKEKLTSDIWISCVSGYLKPDPRAFLTVAEAWRCDPANICVVGDKIPTDMFGARLSGMRAILLNEHATASHFSTGTSIEAVVSSLGDLPRAIMQGLGAQK